MACNRRRPTGVPRRPGDQPLGRFLGELCGADAVLFFSCSLVLATLPPIERAFGRLDRVAVCHRHAAPAGVVLLIPHVAPSLARGVRARAEPPGGPMVGIGAGRLSDRGRDDRIPVPGAARPRRGSDLRLHGGQRSAAHQDHAPGHPGVHARGHAAARRRRPSTGPSRPTSRRPSNSSARSKTSSACSDEAPARRVYTPTIAQQLLARGHDAASVHDHEYRLLERQQDKEAWAAAIAHDRALVSENVQDFRRIEANALAHAHPVARLIFTTDRQFPRGDPATLCRLVNGLDALLAAEPDFTIALEPTGLVSSRRRHRTVHGILPHAAPRRSSPVGNQRPGRHGRLGAARRRVR